MPQCRSCGAKIQWIQLESGKNMPVDEGYFDINEAERGDKLITDEGEVISFNPDLNYEDKQVRVSHFSTCPQADDWRKKK